jgi:hypothetical protein
MSILAACGDDAIHARLIVVLDRGLAGEAAG